MNRTSRRSVSLTIKLALAATAVAPLLAVLSPAPAEAAAPGPLCSSASAAAQAEAQRLSQDLDRVLSARHGMISLAFSDLGTGVTCQLNGDLRFDSASVIKATILATLLSQAQANNRWLSRRDTALATAIITQSDNSAASALWKKVGGHSGVQRFLSAAGMDQTVPGNARAWGLSQITANDQLKLLRLLATGNAVLNDRSRSFELGLMSRVVESQRWGVPTGVRAGDQAANKNGWLPRAHLGWRIHTIGAVTGQHSYLIAVLSEGNPSMRYGVTSVSRISSTINQDVS
jgi:beta-lactamase class A